ncbi:MAG: glycine cleavage system protein H [Candidatus Scalindua sp.]|jgi:glycine cleavage system H protein|nr:glycine cleavage system protein H [Candidatus Scalindua sp.]MBT5306004.1 glycine cleavage system protein H [Candidatus Scalindua sp.]MBT6226998.1 glycine cleavage system protein H [Candidatus Scalindua sp.]MBT6563221.1 glycine cleavage system protein H [Candidatus Scalindua sp.]MBT7210668.1 glycine cleavage system protein H [Candidatus Scalindua sp.]
MKKAKIKFTPEHNWVELKRKVAAIGITDYLIGELGDLIDLCLPKVGEELIYGISYGEIESINILHDLIAPLSGEIVKVNSDLSTSLKVLQKDPYGEGWFIKVRLEETEIIDSLMDEDEYDEYIKSIKKKTKEAGKKKKKVEVKKTAEKETENTAEDKKVAKKKTVTKSKKK